MPRNGAGLYTLPAGNPVVSGTIIDVTWANPTMADIATALTDSLSRTGSGGMLVPFLNADGAVGSPGISWVNESTSGIYRAGGNDQRVSSAGADIVQFVTDADNPLKIFSGGAFRDALNVFADATIAGAWQIDGIFTHSVLLQAAASAAPGAGLNLGVGLAPAAPVNGDIWVDGTAIFARVAGVTQNLTGSNAVGPSTDATRILKGDGAGGWVEAGTGITVTASNDLVLDNASLEVRQSGNGVGMFVGASSASLNSDLGTILFFSTNEPWRFQGGAIFIQEASIALSQVGGHGQLWCEDNISGANPCTMHYVDDTGNDYRIDGIQSRALLSDQVKSNDDVLANVANFSNYHIMPARRYKCIATLFWSSGTVPDIKVAINYDQTAEDLGFAMWTCTSAVSTVETDLELNAFNVIAPTTMPTGSNCLQIEFCFESHATLAGTLALQFAQNVSNAVNTTLLQPSFFIVQENDNIS